eukprot:jgi/Psemu1/59798/gm1.59798_g
MNTQFQPCIQYKQTVNITEDHDSHKLIVDYAKAANRSAGKKNIRRVQDLDSTGGTPNGDSAYPEDRGRDDKGTMIEAFEHYHMAKPKEVSEHAHFNRIDTILDYIGMLHGDNDHDLTEQQRKRMFFKTHAKSWQDSYMDTAVNFREVTIIQIRDYMTRRKDRADKTEKGKKDITPIREREGGE